MALKNDELILYGALGGGVLLLVFSLFGTSWFGQPAQSGQAYSLSTAQIPSECGDINDVENLQHLSHHPDQFQECYKYVDPQKFKAAVGKDLSYFKK